MRSHRLFLLMLVALSAPCEELQVRFYNLSRASAVTVKDASAVIRHLFHGEGAGLAIAWTDGDPADPAAHTVIYGSSMTCPSAPPLGEVRVRLIAAPASVPTSILGFALPCSVLGVHVTIYSDRIEALSRDLCSRSAVILGFVAAHEIGHVLLRSRNHSSAGIMKARWSESDWRSAMAYGLRFSEEQVEQMRVSIAQ